jgi:RNA polymerase sigma-70 factor (ECF subfamily)
MLHDPNDAADVTQEVFLKAYRGIHSFREGSSLRTWLYRIAVREALNQRRWFWRYQRGQISLDLPTEDGCAAFEVEDPAPSPFDELATHELQQAVQTALQSVADVFRTAVILRDIEGLSYEEVAEILEASVGTIKSRVLRGRRALREAPEPILAKRKRFTRGRSTRSPSSVNDSLQLPAECYAED